MLSKSDKDYLIELINNGENIPEDYKQKLFPITQKEYEIVYAGKMRKEDLLANEDGSFPVPLQVEKIFNSENEEVNGWKNMIVFGDNLQLLKTIYKNEDPIIKDRVKGQIKLIYIDPPFATSDEFQNKDGAKAYSDKKQGSEFLEFIRRRLIVAQKVMADDGVIMVHLDQKMVHYVKVIMDEVFGKNNFQNEIIWKYFGPTSTDNNFPRKHDVILFYSNSKEYYFDSKASLVEYDEKAKKRYDKVDNNGKRYKIYYNTDGSIRKAYMKQGKPTDVFNIPFVQGTSKEKIGYPTQKPEKLLAILIQATTKEGDLVMDFFGGSGTTASVCEKMNRRWITCDIGKLSYFTTQKRILQIKESKEINVNKKYKKDYRPFMTCSLGSYDLKNALEMEFTKYKEFVSGLFNIDLIENKIGGYSFDGKKNGNPVIIFDYNRYTDSNIDELFLDDVHNKIRNRIQGGRVYIVSPSLRVDYITDYEELDDIRYYFLKIPYQIIKELHQTDFKKFRQPKSIKDVNTLDDSIGFSFNRTPSVDSSLSFDELKVKISISNFKSDEPRSAKTVEEKQMNDLEFLSAVFVDKKYNGNDFIMTNVFFCDDLANKNNKLDLEFSRNEVGEKIMLVYTDIFGNDLTECYDLK